MGALNQGLSGSLKSSSDRRGIALRSSIVGRWHLNRPVTNLPCCGSSVRTCSSSSNSRACWIILAPNAYGCWGSRWSVLSSRSLFLFAFSFSLFFIRSRCLGLGVDQTFSHISTIAAGNDLPAATGSSCTRLPQRIIGTPPKGRSFPLACWHALSSFAK